MNALSPFPGLVVGAVLFSLGLFTLVAHRSVIRMLFGIELMLNAALLNFAIFASSYGNVDGAVFSVMIMAGAAAEAAVTLALVFALFAAVKSSDMESTGELSG